MNVTVLNFLVFAKRRFFLFMFILIFLSCNSKEEDFWIKEVYYYSKNDSLKSKYTFVYNFKDQLLTDYSEKGFGQSFFYYKDDLLIRELYISYVNDTDTVIDYKTFYDADKKIVKEVYMHPMGTRIEDFYASVEQDEYLNEPLDGWYCLYSYQDKLLSKKTYYTPSNRIINNVYFEYEDNLCKKKLITFPDTSESVHELYVYNEAGLLKETHYYSNKKETRKQVFQYDRFGNCIYIKWFSNGNQLTEDVFFYENNLNVLHISKIMGDVVHYNIIKYKNKSN